MNNVVEGSGEGRFFLKQAGASPSTALRMTVLKKVVLELLA